MTEKYSYRLEIITVAAQEELLEVVRKVAEILPGSQWIEGTASILLGNPDFYAIKTAVEIAGGEDFDIDPPVRNEAAISIFPGEQAMINSTQVTSSSRSLFMLDEIPLLLNYDNLTQQLLQIPGVPNTTYRVNGERVFVFAVFEEQVKEMLIASPCAAISEVGLIALPSAWISASVAVEQFNIVPVPYKRGEVEGKLAIVHESFNAVLPPRFDTESDRDAALAQLLSGEVLAGSGEFEFRGQPMTLLEPLNLNSLPPAPKVNIAESEIKVSTDHTCLRNVDYIPGFALLDFQTFAAIRTTEITWASTNAYVVEQVYKKATLVWKIAQANLNWQVFNSYDNEVPSYGIEDLRELREIYPELATLSNEALYWLFDSYQSDCCGLRCWEPYRENCFLFYLLGKAATEIQASDEKVQKIGEFVGYKSLDIGLSEALKQGQIWFNYDAAIESLIWRTFVVMNFLWRAKEPYLCEPVVTLSNIFVNGGRKVGFSTSK